jgi:outer membrane receptor for ferrienterochelin and colicin
VLGQKDIELRAPSSVVALVNEVPSFRPSNTSISRPAFQGSVGVAVDLRGLGNRRTLALVDKQRMTPAAANGVVDLNLIPTNMIDRTEVVTGGASAAYGSDAVSGVVNFITKKRIDGIQGEISGGSAQAGDDRAATSTTTGATSRSAGSGTTRPSSTTSTPATGAARKPARWSTPPIPRGRPGYRRAWWSTTCAPTTSRPSAG